MPTEQQAKRVDGGCSSPTSNPLPLSHMLSSPGISDNSDYYHFKLSSLAKPFSLAQPCRASKDYSKKMLRLPTTRRIPQSWTAQNSEAGERPVCRRGWWWLYSKRSKAIKPTIQRRDTLWSSSEIMQTPLNPDGSIRINVLAPFGHPWGLECVITEG